jgi:VWFA-related protein
MSGILAMAQDLQHEVTVTLKLIQIYVMNNKDKPITDLGIEDFKIFDNGKLMTLTEFEKHMLSPKTAKSENQERALVPEPESPALNRKFFFLFDMVNNNMRGFQKAQDAARHFIDNQLQPSDEIGVISYSVMKQLTLHEYLTKDHRLIREVVDRIGKTGQVGRAENFEALVSRELSGESGLDVSEQGAPVKEGAPAHLTNPGGGFVKSGYEDFATNRAMDETNNRFKREQFKNIVRNMFERMIGLSKALRYISGHKHIILFSSGVPYSLIHGLETASPTRFTSLGMDVMLRKKYQEMLREMSNSNTTIFSMNTEGLANNMNLPSNQKGEATLRSISNFTGGKFIGNVQNYANVLETVQTFTGSYYILGYYVGESWDGNYHTLKVQVDRPGSNVFAQKGYFNPKPFSEYNKIEKELHLIDLALSDNPLLQTPVPLTMTAVPYHSGDSPGILLLARIPGEKIKASMDKNAELFFLVFDEKEHILDVRRKAINLTALKGEDSLYYALMAAAPGKCKFRIIMRDMDSGQGAVGRYEGDIPQIPETGLQIFPPLLLSPGKSALFVRGYVSKPGKSPFPLLDVFPFDPEQYSPILNTISVGTKKFQAVLRCAMPHLDNPSIKLTAALVNRTSQRAVPLTVSILGGQKTDEMGTLFAEFNLPEIGPGDYNLLVTAYDMTSKARSQTSTFCRIR